MGVSITNKKAPVRRLFDPEAFHTGNYTEITQQCGCLFYKQKSPLYRSHGIYIPLSLYAGSGGTPWGLCPILCPTICVPFRVKVDSFWVCLTKKKPLNKEGLFINQVEDIYFLFFECLTL